MKKIISKDFGGISDDFLPIFIINYLNCYKNATKLIIVKSQKTAKKLSSQIASFDQSNVSILDEFDVQPFDMISPSKKVISSRITTLMKCLNYENDNSNDKNNQIKSNILITTIKAFIQKIAPLDALFGEFLELRKGYDFNYKRLIDFLNNKNYRRVETVYEVGEFAVRGSLIDIFSTCEECPVRIDFFGDYIESIKKFDPVSQRSNKHIDSFSIYPTNEILLTKINIERFKDAYFKEFKSDFDHIIPFQGIENFLPAFYENISSLLDYYSCDNILIEDGAIDSINNIFDCFEKLKNESHHNFFPVNYSYFSKFEIEERLLTKNIITWSKFKHPNSTNFDVQPVPQFFCSIKNLMGFFENDEYKSLNKVVVLLASSNGARECILKMFHDNNFYRALNVTRFPEKTFDKSKIYLFVAPIKSGFSNEDYIVITEEDIFKDSLSKKPERKKRVFDDPTESFQVDDVLVHKQYGIGRYSGLKMLKINDNNHDCLSIMYKGGDTLYLPVENLDILSKYSSEGVDTSNVELDSLKSNSWSTKRDKAKQKIKLIADGLLKIAAEREMKKAPVMAPEAREMEKFCSKFPYVETEDQISAIDATLNDMASTKPMDRLICGDVGFGKTEVALRAAFAAVSSGYQVACIVPTTLLCKQHFETFQNRFDDFNVGQISRFSKPSVNKKTLEGLENGSIDIIIATHALLKQGIKFSNLGLIIIDEEQLFGVKQKEMLKSIKSDVHVLTLTATPIPRTLQLSLAGIRDLSIIATPPIDRLSVRTFVLDPNISSQDMFDAFEREIHRGGQIFYVTPRTERIPILEHRLKSMFEKSGIDSIRIGIAHGKMNTKELEAIISDFYDKKYDILLSTQIIEAGIDIPNANTLIIDKPELFGLSQLHQLRGRVGRSKTQGYMYLVTNKDKLGERAAQRIHLLQSLESLGAGFTISSHDLDIRGSGNIAGEQQSGHIKEIGVGLYKEMLQEAILMARAEAMSSKNHNAISKDRNDKDNINIKSVSTNIDQNMNIEKSIIEQAIEWSPQINLGFPVLIPESYISDISVKLHFYEKISRIRSNNELNALIAEMIDRFGKLPQEVFNLIDVMEVKIICLASNIEKLDVGQKGITVKFRNNECKNPENLIELLKDPELNRQGALKLRPDHSLVFIFNSNPENLKLWIKIFCKKLSTLE